MPEIESTHPLGLPFEPSTAASDIPGGDIPESCVAGFTLPASGPVAGAPEPSTDAPASLDDVASSVEASSDEGPGVCIMPVVPASPGLLDVEMLHAGRLQATAGPIQMSAARYPGIRDLNTFSWCLLLKQAVRASSRPAALQ